VVAPFISKPEVQGTQMDSTKVEFKKALLKLRDKGRFRNTKYLDMLRAQYACDQHTITATRIADAVGYENYNAANLQYGSLGHELADALGYQPPIGANGEPIWFWTLSSGNDASDKTLDSHYEFVMRPELIAALEEMKWVK